MHERAVQATPCGRAGRLAQVQIGQWRTQAFNQVTLHSDLLGAIACLLGEKVSDLRLTQSDLWPKYGHEQRSGKRDNGDQRIHVDYPNHSLAHPSPWDRPELGFPQPGSDYWCLQTLAAVEARYGVFGMDMTPYRRKQ